MTIKKLSAENIEPVGYQILLELLEVEEESQGGIILQASEVNRQQDRMSVGKVLKLGPQCYKNHDSGANSAEDWGFSAGDYVQFPSHQYMRVAGEKSNLVFVIDYDIKARVKL
jgi:co-chaperonin GroES (HSP10)